MQMISERLLFAFSISAGVTRPFLFPRSTFRGRQLFRRLALVGIERRAHAEQSRISRRVRVRRDRVDESFFLAQRAVKPRTAAIAENGRKEIERRHIGMRDLRNVPCEIEAREFGRKFLMHFAPPELRRFLRMNTGFNAIRGYFEKLRDLLVDFLRIDIADHHKKQVVWDGAFL